MNKVICEGEEVVVVDGPFKGHRGKLHGTHRGLADIGHNRCTLFENLRPAKTGMSSKIHAFFKRWLKWKR